MKVRLRTLKRYIREALMHEVSAAGGSWPGQPFVRNSMSPDINIDHAPTLADLDAALRDIDRRNDASQAFTTLCVATIECTMSVANGRTNDKRH